MQRSLALVALVVGMLLVAVACGGGGETTPTPIATRTATPTATTTLATPTPTTPAGDGGNVATGSAVFASSPCIACHKVDSIPGTGAVIGPDLSHIGTVAATRRSGLSAEAYIRESIEDPNAFVAPGYIPNIMPAGLQAGFSASDYEALIAFLVSLE